ncbi:MAG: hypothetical protein BRC29_02420 [Nanohaloarchaea archaeon SW_7_43_1]|nr:MAG: hypothetical protein BRC29_02420 [Nanohaloarchaea archaeon SW_7_43_1]
MSQGKIRSFAPLLGVLTFVMVSTAIISLVGNFTELTQTGKVFMAMFFLAFGFLKACNLEGFKEAFKSYDNG